MRNCTYICEADFPNAARKARPFVNQSDISHFPEPRRFRHNVLSFFHIMTSYISVSVSHGRGLPATISSFACTEINPCQLYPARRGKKLLLRRAPITSTFFFTQMFTVEISFFIHSLRTYQSVCIIRINLLNVRMRIICDIQLFFITVRFIEKKSKIIDLN